jgi:hypothetical protein
VLQESCNLGYAANCSCLPKERSADAVRFGVREAGNLAIIAYVYERAHLPVESGALELSLDAVSLKRPSGKSCLQRMAECVLDSRRRGPTR